MDEMLTEEHREWLDANVPGWMTDLDKRLLEIVKALISESIEHRRRIDELEKMKK